MTESKRLYRSRSDRMISGVCGGLGLFVGGSAVALYIVMMIVVPEEPLPASDSVVEAEESEEA